MCIEPSLITHRLSTHPNFPYLTQRFINFRNHIRLHLPKIHWSNIITRIVGILRKEKPSKNWRMPLFATRTRYSLVKGERIVRFVLTAWLREFCSVTTLQFYMTTTSNLLVLYRCGTLLVASLLISLSNIALFFTSHSNRSINLSCTVHFVVC